MTVLGENVISVLETAVRDVLIVAPFVRAKALDKLLSCIPAGTQITVVTRWRPTDLLMGVADLGVYDSTASKGAKLYLRYDLHAKLFAADDRCLIGSANVTDTALGWRSPENLELLVMVQRSEPQVARFEERLMRGAISATVALRDRLATFLDKCRNRKLLVPEFDLEELGQLQPDWIPRIRNPEELFSAYIGSVDFGRAALQEMREDLNQMGATPGMNEPIFREWVAAAISQTPLIQTVISQIEQKGEVTESDVAAFLREFSIDASVFRPREVLENLERWLSCFFPAQYETARESIKLIRAQSIGVQVGDNL